MSRVRSPAVTTPWRLPCRSTTATVPRFSASKTTHSRIGRSGSRVGTSFVSITSATRSSRFRPSVPPGWNAAKSSRRNCFFSSSVTARASPSASATVVLAVGARVSGHASSVTPASSTTSACRASTESGSPVNAMIGTPSRFNWFTSPNSSSDVPLFDSKMATSLRPTIPRSPWSESTGWRNEAGVPVDVKVAAILRAIRPDLPTPDTMIRPVAAASNPTAAANGGPSRSATPRIAAASRASTRRPRSTRSVGPVRDIATLDEILSQQPLPLAPGLEDQLRHLAHRALAARDGGHRVRRRLHLGDRVRDRDGEPHARQERQVREVVPHEGALFPGQSTPLAQRFEHRQLACARVLDQLVHGELARPERGRRGFPAADPHDGEAGGPEQPDAQPVLDVETLELDGVVADHAQVHAVVGEHAVDVQADELEAAGERGLDHRRARAFTSLSTDGLPPPLPDLDRDAYDARELVERQHVRPVGRRPVGIGVRLEEEPVRACGGSRIQERRDELAQAAARTPLPPAPLLPRR